MSQIDLQPPQNLHKQLSKGEHYPVRPVRTWGQLSFANSDWAGYSVFEEASTAGDAARHWPGA